MVNRPWILSLVSLLATVLFFAEYGGPLAPEVHIPFDLDGFHYSLVNSAFLSLRDGRLPLWDAATYSGIPLAGNIQAALFYPPTWLMFLASSGQPRLPYKALEWLVFGHVWLCFVLAYFWLHKGRGHGQLASFAGAASLACGAYACGQITHFGLICALTWFPLGFWALDGLARGQTTVSRAIAKLAAASALAFLAGYTPTWMCFCICMVVYAAAGRNPGKALAVCAAGLALSAGLAAVQLAPTAEASAHKTFDPKYGLASGQKNPEYFISYVVPNFYDFELGVEVGKHPGKDMLYLGSLAILGLLGFLAFGLRRRLKLREALPAVAALIASVLFFINPWAILGGWIEPWPLLSQMMSSWYFLAGIAAAAAPLVAIGIESIALQPSGSTRAGVFFFWLVIAAAILWTLYLLSIWGLHWRPLASGLSSIADGVTSVVVCVALLWLWRSADSGDARRTAAGFILVFFALADWKVFGTSKRLNAYAGPSSMVHSPTNFPGMSPQALAAMTSHPESRVLFDEWNYDPNVVRHLQLRTPQGFDPFLPQAYFDLMQQRGKPWTNRHFRLPLTPEALDLFGVRYIVSARTAEQFAELSGAPERFRLLGPADSAILVFEHVGAKPTYGWDGDLAVHVWNPEHRRFQVRNTATAPATFRLTEQYYPGWTATIDGNPARIERCQRAFQCVQILPGNHAVEFHYWPRSLTAGAVVSTFSTGILVLLLLRRA